LVQDPGVDVVYVATPTHLHAGHCRMALEHAKAVLCEKPFGRTEIECASIADTARQRRIFCMEAMWMRFNPIVQQVRSQLAERQLGTVRAARIEIGYRKDPISRGAPADARGAMLVFGCYGVSLAHCFFGRPAGISAAISRLPNGVDETCVALLRYPALAVTLAASVGATLTNEAAIFGDHGTILIDDPFFNATRATISALEDDAMATQPSPKTRIGRLLRRGRARAARLLTRQVGPRTLLTGERNAGLAAEAAEVMRCLAAGETESPVMPLAESLDVHRTIDAILAASPDVPAGSAEITSAVASARRPTSSALQ
jgi:predicted dehydrogenase